MQKAQSNEILKTIEETCFARKEKKKKSFVVTVKLFHSLVRLSFAASECII